MVCRIYCAVSSLLTRRAATEYWTETNIANGLNALATCIEVRVVQCSLRLH